MSDRNPCGRKDSVFTLASDDTHLDAGPPSPPHLRPPTSLCGRRRGSGTSPDAGGRAGRGLVDTLELVQHSAEGPSPSLGSSRQTPASLRFPPASTVRRADGPLPVGLRCALLAGVADLFCFCFCFCREGDGRGVGAAVEGAGGLPALGAPRRQPRDGRWHPGPAGGSGRGTGFGAGAGAGPGWSAGRGKRRGGRGRGSGRGPPRTRRRWPYSSSSSRRGGSALEVMPQPGAR